MSTTIGNLIDNLSKYPRETLVYQSKDSEGNKFISVDECSEMYVDKNFDGDTIEDEVWDEEDLTGGYEPQEYSEVLDGFQKIIVIWPVQ